MENEQIFILERLYNSDKKIFINKGPQSYTCGRDRKNHIVCANLLVSRKHCIFFHSNDGLFVTDLKSSNGIFINGVAQAAFHTKKLNENDIIGIGCSDIDPDDSSKFIYRVRTSKPCLTEEETNNDVSSTINLDCNEVLENNMSNITRVLGEKCKSDSLNYDTDVQYKIQKHVDNNECDINAGSSKADLNSFNPPSCSSDASGLLGIKTEPITENEEDDIQIVHISLNRDIINKNDNFTSIEHLKDINKQDFIKTEPKESLTVPIKCEKMDIDKDNEKDDNTNDNSSRRSTSTASTSTSTNSSSSTSTTTSISSTSTSNDPYLKNGLNFTCIGDQAIKMEDELQLTDEEEEAHSAIAKLANEQASNNINPIKYEKIKQEVKTQYSEVDIVNLSDDEKNIFPYSQLFDIGFNSSQEHKVEIKQECIDDEIEKIEFLNDEIIILTDSEDEVNPWLERLSRSQVLKEEKEFILNEPIIKDEVDLDVPQEEENEFIFNESIIKDEVDLDIPQEKEREPILNEPIIKDEVDLDVSQEEEKEPILNEPIIKDEVDLDVSQEDMSDLIEPETCTFETFNKETSIETPMIIDEDKSENEDDKSTDSAHELNSTHYKNEQKTDEERHNKETISLPSDTKQSSEKKQIRASKKSVPIIEAQHLPSHSRWGINKDKTSKKRSKLTAEEKKARKRKEKQDKEEQKNRRMTHKCAAESLPPTNFIKLGYSKKEQETMKAFRQKKLKEIAAAGQSLKQNSNEEIQNTKTVKPGVSKPGVKVTQKNRGDFLVNDQCTSKLTSNVPTKSSETDNNQSKKESTDKIIVPDKPVTSEVKIMKSPPKCNLSKKTVDNVATSLEKSLHLNNVSDAIKKSKKESNAKDFNAVDEHSKEKHSKEKRNDLTTEISESRNKSTSMSMQKENFSPNNLKSECTSKPIKKVSFAEETIIKEYQIDPQNNLRKAVAKDAPIPKNKLVKTNCELQIYSPKLEEYLHDIFKWNPIWLEEQRYSKEAPPILQRGKILQPMKLRYESYMEYYNVVLPLLLHETWSAISKEFETIEKNMQRVTVMCSVMKNSITRTHILLTNLFYTTLNLQILMPKEYNKSMYPTVGDLIILELVKNETNRQSFQRVFAYITHMNETVITNFTLYNKDLGNYVRDPYFVITYTISTRDLAASIPENRIHRIRTVIHLRPHLRRVQALQYLPQSPLVKLILNPVIEDYQLPPINLHTSVLFSREKLVNTEQLNAIFKVSKTVLKKEPKLCLIQGPPGTGKSKVIVNLITQIWYSEKILNKKKNPSKILVCTSSNAAIDEIVLRLKNIKEIFNLKLVRIGQSESMHQSVSKLSALGLAKTHLKKTTEILNIKPDLLDMTNPVEEEKAKLEQKMNKCRNELEGRYNMDNETKNCLKCQLSELQARYDLLNLGIPHDELPLKERKKFIRISENFYISNAEIIACTLSSCFTQQMESIFGGNKEKIPICIVDEATQSCEAETLIPLMLGVKTLVLVGDTNQLPATVINQQAKKLGLDQSLFSRIQNVFELQSNNPVITLNMQYRMVPSISYWPNKYFYGGYLQNGVDTDIEFPLHAYRVLNHNSTQDFDKFSNINEAEFVANMILNIIYTEWHDRSLPISVGILAPYNIQKQCIKNKIEEKMLHIDQQLKNKVNVDVQTVDGFQGQERDIIIMSCVRSDGIGFLADRQRLCVALTRAKSSLILCGNFNAFSRDLMWNALLSDARSRNVYLNVDAGARHSTIRSYIIKEN